MESSAGLPSTIVRNLSDRLYEKRKNAALEIEQLIRDMLQRQPPDLNGIETVMGLLIKDFAESPQANFRKGGLIGLAATTVALANMDGRACLREPDNAPNGEELACRVAETQGHGCRGYGCTAAWGGRPRCARRSCVLQSPQAQTLS